MKRTSSITIRFLVYLIGIIVLSNLITFAINYFVAQNNMRIQSVDMGRNLMESNLTMMEQYFGDIDNIADSIIYNYEVIQFMKSEQDKVQDLKFLDGIVSLYYNSRPDLQIIFYKERNYNNKYSINNNVTSNFDFRDFEWYQQFAESSIDKSIIVNNTDEDGKAFVHSIIYRIRDVYGENTVGYLGIDIDLTSLKERFLHNYTKIAGTTISDFEGKVLFYDKMVVKVPDAAYQKPGKDIYETKDYIMCYGISENTGWRLCIAMSKQEIFKNQGEMVKILAFALLLIIAATILASKKFFVIITENYRRLVEGMKRVKQGNLTTQVKTGTPDEINFLIEEFNEMMKNVDELVKMVESKQILLKEAEIKALQQQINPHFMFNIMETIMGLARVGMDEAIITVSKCMSNMLRYNTRFGNITVLKEELKQVQNYVQVLKIRFEDKFEVFYDIDEECLDFQIVKFTLQPLVENALSHGLSEKKAGGMLRIRVKLEGQFISIMVFDNGAGIPSDQLAELDERLKATSEHPLEYIERYKSLGVLNVHLRLKLYYGKTYSMEIFSKEGKGTCISIKIPSIPELAENLNSESLE